MQSKGACTVQGAEASSLPLRRGSRAPRPRRGPTGGLRVRTTTPHAIGTATVAAWSDLEARALEANAYLSPHFVLPALRHLEPAAPIVIVLVERGPRRAAELLGVGVFRVCPPSLRFPLGHLAAYRSCHSYLSGLLVDHRAAAMVVQTFFDFFCGAVPRWHGIEFIQRTAEGPLAELMAATALSRGLPWGEYSRTPRALLVPATAGEGYLTTRLASRYKAHCRNLRRLGQHGPVDWRVQSGSPLPVACVDRFLELEDMGWKGQQGTSLRARPEDERFFRAMMDGFSRCGRAFFTELCVNHEVIASTSNVVSGHAGFTFKVGWHPGYAKLAPGLLNELELIRHAPTLWAELAYLDSGAAPGSYMDELWAGRCWLTSGLYATTGLGRQVLAALQPLYRVKRWLRRRQEGKGGH